MGILEQSLLDAEGRLYFLFLFLEMSWLECGLSSRLSDKESMVLRALVN